MTAVHNSNFIQPKRGVMSPAVKLNTIEPCLEDATLLVNKLRQRLTDHDNKRLLQAFTALADGDSAVGMLAFYLWRRNARRRT